MVDAIVIDRAEKPSDTKPDSPEQMKSALLKWDSIWSDVQEQLGLRFDSAEN